LLIILLIILSFVFFSDTFDENTPPSDNPNYISSLGAAIYEGMQSGDSQAIWLMQVSDAMQVYSGTK
jgi:Alpha-N-acetylglucosaminidase (NAGLU) tim-barrel domain